MKNLLKLDCYPDKAQYLKQEKVHLILEGDWDDSIEKIQIVIKDLNHTVLEKEIVASDLSHTSLLYGLELDLPLGNYGVDVNVIGQNSEQYKKVHTAFDIVDSNSSIVRYGFLADFSPEEKEDDTDILYARKLHLNALQFYDWMYRHDSLISPDEEYAEPLGRMISLKTIENKIKLCKEYGIRPFAYGAVYAASKAAYEKNPSWAVYKKNGEPLLFADWLVFMNTSKGEPWYQHILNEYLRSIKDLGFQGIHMDTYGFPKFVWNNRKERFSLAETFPDMIEDANTIVKSADSKAGVIFNAVNNWPVEYIAKTNQDAVYIEVWPPHVTYHHLYTLIREGKYLGGKQVILAAYMEPFKNIAAEEDILAAQRSLLLTNAVILASGGTQLVFGETNGILCDSYYVKYATLQEKFLPMVQSYCDFTVRYGKLLFHRDAMDISMTAANGINEDIKFSLIGRDDISFSSDGAGGKIWTLIKETEKFTIIQLINLTNVNEYWNEPKYQQPELIDGIQVDLLMDANVVGVYCASPDEGDTEAISIDYQLVEKDNGQHVVFQIPFLHIWDLVWIETE